MNIYYFMPAFIVLFIFCHSTQYFIINFKNTHFNMFEEFTIQAQKMFQEKVEHLCIGSTGVIIATTRRKTILSHLQGCQEDINLIQYFQAEMALPHQKCWGAREVANQCNNITSCCFAVIMDSTLWCLIVSINSEATKGNTKLQVFQLKMLMDNPSKIERRLRFVELCRPDMLVLSQVDNKLTQIVPDQQHIDKFDCFELLDFQLGKQGEEPLGELEDFVVNSHFFILHEPYVVMCYQLRDNDSWKHHIFFYKMNRKSLMQTFPEKIVTLPLFQDERLLAYLQIIPTEEHTPLETSFLLAYYQLPQGIEVVEVTFENSQVINRKFLYSNLHFVEFISSSITQKELEVKGTEACLQNHSVLMLTSEGIGMSHSLTLVNLPSTGSPKVANQLLLPSWSRCLRITEKSLWMFGSSQLYLVRKKSKREIYRSLMKVFSGKGSQSLSLMEQQLLCLLE